MSGLVPVAIDLLVAVLLAITIGYCVVLNRRLKRLRADDASLRETITELVSATGLAERAIRDLKDTIGRAERDLGETLARADATKSALGRIVEEAARAPAPVSAPPARPRTLAEAVRPTLGPSPAPPPPPAARPAQAFTSRSAFSTGGR